MLGTPRYQNIKYMKYMHFIKYAPIPETRVRSSLEEKPGPRTDPSGAQHSYQKS